MKEKTHVGHLWDLVQQFLDDQPFPVSERQLAQKLGYASSSTFDGWRNPKKLPAAQGLARFAVTAGISYQRVLDAALEDTGYLPRPEVTAEPLGSRKLNPIDDERDGPAPKVADVLAERRRLAAASAELPPDDDLDDLDPEEPAAQVFGETTEQIAARKKEQKP